VKVVLAKRGAPVAAPPILQGALALDLLLACVAAALGPAEVFVPGLVDAPASTSWAIAAFGVAVIVCDVLAARMVPAGITWRRRLGFVAMGAVLWRGWLHLDKVAIVAVVVWMGFVWLALVVAGRALSRSIAAATGEDKPE
jgi:hypothetical protein